MHLGIINMVWTRKQLQALKTSSIQYICVNHTCEKEGMSNGVGYQTAVMQPFPQMLSLTSSYPPPHIEQLYILFWIIFHLALSLFAGGLGHEANRESPDLHKYSRVDMCVKVHRVGLQLSLDQIYIFPGTLRDSQTCMWTIPPGRQHSHALQWGQMECRSHVLSVASAVDFCLILIILSKYTSK